MIVSDDHSYYNLLHIELFLFGIAFIELRLKEEKKGKLMKFQRATTFFINLLRNMAKFIYID